MKGIKISHEWRTIESPLALGPTRHLVLRAEYKDKKRDLVVATSKVVTEDAFNAVSDKRTYLRFVAKIMKDQIRRALAEIDDGTQADAPKT